MRKKFSYICAAVAILSIGFLGAVGVKANAKVAGNDSQSLLIQKLAERFNLKTDDIQKVFDEVQQQREQEMQQKMEAKYKERLDKMVSSNKLTQAQEDAILAKRQEIQNKYKELDETALTVKERNGKIKEIQDGLKKWAEDNGIDFRLINNMLWIGRGFGGGGFEKGFAGGPHGFGQRW